MKIILLYNSAYISYRYNFDLKFLSKFEVKIFPNLVKRLSLESLVESIDIFSDIDFNNQNFSSSKINFYKSNTELNDNISIIFSKFFSIYEGHESTVVFLNPLFPFVSIEHLYEGYQNVKSGNYRSAIGYVSLDYDNLYDKDNVVDWGIFNVVNKDAFLQSNSRLIYPTHLVKLSAVELISLRGDDDIDLYDLIVNSGML
jgi:hypothetical protein